MKIRCRQCAGYYKVRDGKFGVFAGCSNYPACRSTLKLHELVMAYIQEKGIRIYRWNKVCWKCGKETPVYSYYLGYELEELDEYLGSFGMVGLGELPCVDQILEKEIPSIQPRYSNTIKSRYTANTCIHCGAMQGRNYVVEDPHEIMDELMFHHDMEKYYDRTIRMEDYSPLIPYLRSIYSTKD